MEKELYDKKQHMLTEERTDPLDSENTHVKVNHINMTGDEKKMHASRIPMSFKIVASFHSIVNSLTSKDLCFTLKYSLLVDRRLHFVSALKQTQYMFIYRH